MADVGFVPRGFEPRSLDFWKGLRFSCGPWDCRSHSSSCELELRSEAAAALATRSEVLGRYPEVPGPARGGEAGRHLTLTVPSTETTSPIRARPETAIRLSTSLIATCAEPYLDSPPFLICLCKCPLSLRGASITMQFLREISTVLNHDVPAFKYGRWFPRADPVFRGVAPRGLMLFFYLHGFLSIPNVPYKLTLFFYIFLYFF